MKPLPCLILILTVLIIPAVASAQTVKEGDHVANAVALLKKPAPRHHRPHLHQAPVTYPR